MNAETAASAILMLLSLPMLGPMLIIVLLLQLISVIIEKKEANRK